MIRACLILCVAVPLVRADEPKAPTTEVRLSDGSRILVVLLDDTLPLQTPHGKLSIPLVEIRRIEFATRLSGDVLAKIDAAIGDLASTELSKREAAGERLVKIGRAAYPAVVRASKSPNRDLSISARKLREKFLEAFSEERLPQHDYDTIHTDEAKIAGRIDMQTVRVRIPQFGEKTIKLTDVVSMKIANAIAPEVKINAQPDPGSLTSLAQNTNQSYYFTVTGNINGSVYGTDKYTTDSQLATAAVHCGALRNGETGVVKVTILAGENAYVSTTQNGVTSSNWGPYSASYKVSKARRDDE